MGTVALIGIQTSQHPSLVKYIRLMTDGYVSELGFKLLLQYSSTKQAHDLIECGNIVGLRHPLEESLFCLNKNKSNWDECKPITDEAEGTFYLSTEAAIKYLFINGEWNVFINGLTPQPVSLYDFLKNRFEDIDAKTDNMQEEQFAATRVAKKNESI